MVDKITETVGGSLTTEEKPTAAQPDSLRAGGVEELKGPEREIVDRIDQDGDPGRVLQDIAAGGVISAEEDETPFGRFLAEADSEGELVVGGELITPDVRRADEKDDRGAIQRGWLAAIDRAYARIDLSVEQHLQNIQRIVNVAMEVGVSPDELRIHLQTLGIEDAIIIQRETNGERYCMPSGRSATWVRTGAYFDDGDNLVIEGPMITGVMSRPSAVTCSTMYSGAVNVGIHIPLEIDLAARRAEAKCIDSYLSYVARQMGWSYDKTTWICLIPPGGYERLTEEQYNRIKAEGQPKKV
jgi:hypothetical protein